MEMEVGSGKNEDMGIFNKKELEMEGWNLVSQTKFGGQGETENRKDK